MNCWDNTFGYKHLGWLHSFDFIRKWPLKTLNKTGYHDGVKATPKWFIELGLIGLKPFMLQLFFIFSAGNHCFPVFLMALNIYLSPALIGFLCLLLSFPMGMKVDLKFNAKWDPFPCTLSQHGNFIIPCEMVTMTILPSRPVIMAWMWEPQQWQG